MIMRLLGEVGCSKLNTTRCGTMWHDVTNCWLYCMSHLTRMSDLCRFVLGEKQVRSLKVAYELGVLTSRGM